MVGWRCNNAKDVKTEIENPPHSTPSENHRSNRNQKIRLCLHHHKTPHETAEISITSPTFGSILNPTIWVTCPFAPVNLFTTIVRLISFPLAFT